MDKQLKEKETLDKLALKAAQDINTILKLHDVQMGELNPAIFPIFAAIYQAGALAAIKFLMEDEPNG